jgi:hypothetical protein
LGRLSLCWQGIQICKSHPNRQIQFKGRNSMFGVFAAAGLFLSSYFLMKIFDLRGLVEKSLGSFCLACGNVIVWGNILSSFNCLGNLKIWSLLSLGNSFLLAFLFYKKKRPVSGEFFQELRQSFFKYRDLVTVSFSELVLFEKLILFPLVFTFIALSLVNLFVVFFTAPSNWDSLAYHLPRIAYFLQNNNASSFESNYWAQVVHPKNSSFLFLFTFLVTGRNENLIQFVQYVSYLASVVSIYGISRKLEHTRVQSIFSAMIGGLLTEWLMEATTTQNDLIITAFIGTSVFFLLVFNKTRNKKHLFLFFMSLSLAIGTKSSAFLVLPSVALIAVFLLLRSWPGADHRPQVAISWAGIGVLSFCIFVLPSGYFENLQKFGHPLGPVSVRTSHSFEGQPPGYVFKQGTKNLARYGFEFFSLDGTPAVRPFDKIQVFFKNTAYEVVSLAGVDLKESDNAKKGKFRPEKLPHSHEDHSYWGIFGFGLILVVILQAVFGVFKSAEVRLFSAATILFFFCQAYSSPFDIWRGRYFICMAIFSAPIVGNVLHTGKTAFKVYLVFIVWFGCLSAFTAVFLRNNGSILPLEGYVKGCTKSTFFMNRFEHFSRNTGYLGPLKAFDRLTPATARVAIFLPPDSIEFPLFGEKCTRTIIPINSFEKGPRQIPSNADFLLYSSKIFPCPQPGDIALGLDWFLRPLTPENGKCPEIGKTTVPST